uniref:BTB domain-containing protein n=1 Tax=Steinernema glaseri TaxID=37863 RepID=A0A1I8APX1_9BILA
MISSEAQEVGEVFFSAWAVADYGTRSGYTVPPRKTPRRLPLFFFCAVHAHVPHVDNASYFYDLRSSKSNDGPRMTNIGKITGTLEDEACSPEVEIGGAKWSLHRCDYTKFYFNCTVGDEPDVLWSCTARGRLIVWDSQNGRQFLMWTDSFDDIHGAGIRHSAFKFPPCNLGEKVQFTAEIEVMKMRTVDLSAPPNKSIESPEDAACLEVEDEKLWVSKQILSVHSPFFKAMFSSDFKENATGIYALKEVKLDDFDMFLSVLYNLNIPITTHESLKSLLRLADMWQCESVLRFCRDFLSGPESTFLSLRTKIALCDRHGFCLILEDTIRNAKLEDLKKLAKEGYFAELTLSSFAHCLIEQRFADSE